LVGAIRRRRIGAMRSGLIGKSDDSSGWPKLSPGLRSSSRSGSIVTVLPSTVDVAAIASEMISA